MRRIEWGPQSTQLCLYQISRSFSALVVHRHPHGEDYKNAHIWAPFSGFDVIGMRGSLDMWNFKSTLLTSLSTPRCPHSERVSGAPTSRTSELLCVSRPAASPSCFGFRCGLADGTSLSSVRWELSAVCPSGHSLWKALPSPSLSHSPRCPVLETGTAWVLLMGSGHPPTPILP